MFVSQCIKPNSPTVHWTRVPRVPGKLAREEAVSWHVDSRMKGWVSVHCTAHTTIIWSHIAQFSNSPSSVRPERTEQSKGFSLKIKVFCLKIKLFWKNKSIVLKIKVLSIKIRVYYPKGTLYFKATLTKKLITHKFN